MIIIIEGTLFIIYTMSDISDLENEINEFETIELLSDNQCNDPETEQVNDDDDLLSEASTIEIPPIYTDIDDMYCCLNETACHTIDNNIIDMFRHKFHTIIKSEIISDLHNFMEPGAVDSIDEMIDEAIDIQMDSYPKYQESHQNIAIPVNDISLERCINVPQVAQKSEEWYKQRMNMMTASNMWKIIKSDATRNSFIYDKCKMDNTQIFSQPMDWGNKYEPVSTMLYEMLFNTKVTEFGCIPHKEYPMIGASPDGIVLDKEHRLYGRMLEIKNIYNRDIVGVPKEEYWVQMQIQMEVCDLDACDFLETRFKEYDDNSFFNDASGRIRGVIAENVDGRYYHPICDTYTIVDVSEWLCQYGIATASYYYLDEYSCVTVMRNSEWFNRCLPHFLETWETILKERVDGYEHRLPKPREKKQVNVVKLDVDMEEVERVAKELSKEWDDLNLNMDTSNN